MISRPASGALWIAASAALGAGFEVYLGHIVQSLDPIAVNTVCFGAIALVHLGFEVARDAGGFVAKVRASWLDLLFFNLSSVLASSAWVISFRWLEPSAAKVIVSSVGPLLTVIFGPLLLGSSRQSPRALAAVAGTALSATLLIWGAVSGFSGVRGLTVHGAWIGALSAVLSGLGIVFNMLYMKRFELRGWSISEMLSARLVLIVLLGAFLWPGKGAPGVPGVADLPALAAVGLGWVWAPIFAFQWGLEMSDPVTASLIVAASPVLTLLFQGFDTRLVYSPVTVAAVCLNTAAAVFGQWPKVTRDTVFNPAKSGIK